jgi:hypothetical protein
MTSPDFAEGLRTTAPSGGDTNAAAWERALCERPAVERYIDKILAPISRAAEVVPRRTHRHRADRGG